MAETIIGTALFHRTMEAADNDPCRSRGELQRKVWSPTPWMVDVLDDGREHEIRNWLNRRYGRESSPIHGHVGTWHRGYVTINGHTWYGFATERMLLHFLGEFG